jgi:hypothetical protein
VSDAYSMALPAIASQCDLRAKGRKVSLVAGSGRAENARRPARGSPKYEKAAMLWLER